MPVATDGHGLELKNIGPTLSSFNAMPVKKKKIHGSGGGDKCVCVWGVGGEGWGWGRPWGMPGMLVAKL